ncbi:Protein-arginine deiminase type-1 [Myotis brandtii]|uniref:Protein-arginine deiminase type-1 n=1 Tax=Myotis brandtii TaxID=109478 RepID=S7MGN2_MYOBR|nr:Protein-arginine deiminase type-1 [Myotis brandtii]
MSPMVLTCDGPDKLFDNHKLVLNVPFSDSKRVGVFCARDLKDMSPMVLTCDGPDKLFDNHKLVLNVPFSDSKRVGVFCARGGNSLSHYKQVLGPQHLSYEVERQPGEQKINFYVEGLTFPNADFSGLVSLSVSLVDMGTLPEVPIFTDTVAFRMAPWIMTPNTQPPLELYVCSVIDAHGSNEKFLKDMSDLVSKANCKLIICPWIENRNDRWIQDEMEFGYVEAPHKSFPVVFDSPRDRGLKEFSYNRILGPDFGYVTQEIPFAGASGLDSFGNLDVSPPVTVGGKEYPLGRILIGSNFPKTGGRRMAKVVRDFLKAQQVQAPVELYSDWLSVGHVDEFLTFVPTSDQKGNPCTELFSLPLCQGFRLLLASPSACLKLFQEKRAEGYGKAVQFDGLEEKVKRSINELLADRSLQSDSLYVQKCIDWNREVLKRELGLTERDIVDIPQLFYLRGPHAEAFFPDMWGSWAQQVGQVAATSRAVISSAADKQVRDCELTSLAPGRGLSDAIGTVLAKVPIIPLGKDVGISVPYLHDASSNPRGVNMVVLGKYLGIPKPYGPIINGRCCLEEKVRSLLEPLGLHCIFIDDFLSYHKLLGEIHCGTNVRRQPFSFKWWHMVP